jgi:hypothetical protein
MSLQGPGLALVASADARVSGTLLISGAVLQASGAAVAQVSGVLEIHGSALVGSGEALGSKFANLGIEGSGIQASATGDHIRVGESRLLVTGTALLAAGTVFVQDSGVFPEPIEITVESATCDFLLSDNDLQVSFPVTLDSEFVPSTTPPAEITGNSTISVQLNTGSLAVTIR